MGTLLRRIAFVLSLSLAAGILCGFTALPPENWERMDPHFHLTPPAQPGIGDEIFGVDGNGNIIIMGPAADGFLIPTMPREQNNARIVLLCRSTRFQHLPQ